MKTLLALVCCLSLASVALGENSNDPNIKKKKNANTSNAGANQGSGSNNSGGGKRGNAQGANRSAKSGGAGNSGSGNASGRIGTAVSTNTPNNGIGGQGDGTNNSGGKGGKRNKRTSPSAISNNGSGADGSANNGGAGKTGNGRRGSKTTNTGTAKNRIPPAPNTPPTITKDNLKNNDNTNPTGTPVNKVVRQDGTTNDTGNGTAGNNQENKWLNTKDANGNPIFDQKTGKMIDTKNTAGTTGNATGLKDENGNPIIDQRPGATTDQTIKDANAAGVGVTGNTGGTGTTGNSGMTMNKTPELTDAQKNMIGGNAGNTGAVANAGINNQGPGANNPKRKKPLNGGSWTNGKFKTKTVVIPAKPRQNIVSVKFVPGNRIANSQTWVGPKYGVFKTYRSEWHDRSWWQQRHANDMVLISGGYYYRRGNYWFPAWGYDNSASFYPYDGPIFAYNGLRPDQVVANVQTALQELGYYQDGEVDGLLGPMTREALSQFQNDNALPLTAAIDEPTLQSLGMD